MPLSGTGERVTPVLDFPSRDGLSVQAIRGRLRAGRLHARSRTGHPVRRVRVRALDGSVMFGLGDEPVELTADESCL